MNKDLVKNLSDESLQKLREKCIDLISTRQPLDKVVGMKPYHLWVAINIEQCERQVAPGGKYGPPILRETDSK